MPGIVFYKNYDEIVRTVWRHTEFDGNGQTHLKMMSNKLNGPKVAKFLVG